MAKNSYVNKVEFGGTALIDLTKDTVTPASMLSGVTAHSASGASITGALVPVLGVEVNGSTETPDANGIVDVGTVPNPSKVLSLTLAAGSWSSATPPTQTLTAVGVTASNNIIVSPASSITAEQLDALAAAKIICTAQAANSITLTCYGTQPAVNVPISVLIMG